MYEHESCLNYVTIRKFRRILAQFRVSAHSLEIERGRYCGIARRDRMCKICQSSIEDEYHFDFICDIYKDLKVKIFRESIWYSNLANVLVTVMKRFRLNLLCSSIMPRRDA